MKEKKKLLITTDSFAPRWDGIVRFLLETLPHLKDDYEISKVLEAYKKSSKPFSGNTIQEIINESGFNFRKVNGRLRQLINTGKIFQPKKFQYVIEEYKKIKKPSTQVMNMKEIVLMLFFMNRKETLELNKLL